MKKTALILLGSLFCVIACTPRDPDVLSQGDRDFLQQQKDKGRAGSSSAKNRPLLPARVDVSLGLLMLDRESEAFLVLQKAQNLLAGQTEKTQEGCVRSKLISKEKNLRLYQISQDLCVLSYGDVTHTVNGKAQLRLELSDSGELVRLSYDTPNLSDGGLSVTEYQVSKKDYKMAFSVKDEVHLLIEKKEGSHQFRLTSLVANSSYRQLIEAAETVGQISYEADGDWEMNENGDIQSQIHAKLRLKSQVLNTGNGVVGGDSYFDLVMDSYNQTPTAKIVPIQCSRAQGSSTYELSFGANSRKGLLTLEGNVLTAVSLDPKSQKESKFNWPLAECAQRPALAWDQLMQKSK